MNRAQWTMAFIALTAATAGAAQQMQPQAGAISADAANAPSSGKSTKVVTGKDKRRATKLYLQGSKLFEKGQYEASMRDYQEAATLDPENQNFAAANEVARSHKVTELIQTAAKAHLRGDTAAESAAIQKAATLDPRNIEVTEHLHEMAADAEDAQARPRYGQGADSLAPAPVLEPTPDKHSFHQKGDRHQLIQTVFKAYGIDASVDQSVTGPPIRFELDDADFNQATDALNLATDSFTVPLDAHRALVAKDNRENRQQYERTETETVYLGGMQKEQSDQIVAMAKNVFQMQQVVPEPGSGTLTVRSTSARLNAFNATLQQLLDGKSQVLLDVRLIQLANSNQRNTGVTPPQQITAFNVYSEEQSILNQNQALVQQIISSGLASPGDTLAILGILLASGQVSSSLFQNGIVLFGGGLTLTGLAPGQTRVNLSLNSSQSRELDQIQLHLGDGEEGTIKSGSRYPIMTSNYSNLGTTGLNIAGLTSAGTSGSLTSLLSQLNTGTQTIPQVQYQDLGLTFKATPSVTRAGDIALSMDLTLTALAGSSINGVPILNNRNYSTKVRLKEGSAVVLVSEIDKEESRLLSGMPGLTEIPGLNGITGTDVTRNYASLLIIITPHVVRGTQTAGHTPMLRVERGQALP